MFGRGGGTAQNDSMRRINWKLAAASTAAALLATFTVQRVIKPRLKQRAATDETHRAALPTV